MEGEYRSTMQKKELFLWEEHVSSEAGYYIKMLQYNRIPGVLPFTEEQTEGRQGYRYEIGTRCALTEYREYDRMNHVQIEKLVRGIIEVIERGREYLIHEGDFVLSPEYIFLAPDSERVHLCCYPLPGDELRQQFAGLFEYLLSHIDYQDFVAVRMAYELYMKSKTAGCRFADFLEILARYGNHDECDATRQENSQTDFVKTDVERKGVAEKQESHSGGQAGCSERQATCVEGQAERQKQTDRITETVSETPGYCLRAESAAASIKITALPCYLGSEGGILETENAELSPEKTQARISMQKNSVYIEDANSEKGTFVNGRRIAGNEIYKLNIGDSVMLADRCYRFVREG